MRFAVVSIGVGLLSAALLVGPSGSVALGQVHAQSASELVNAEGPESPIIVSLGDSYSSGEGAAYSGYDYDEGTNGANNKCHRSEIAWPRLVGATQEQHFACSGAKAANLRIGGGDDKDKDNNPKSQIQRLAAYDADLLRTEGRHVDMVTLTIGGNDMGFAKIIGDCLKNNNCLAGFMADEDEHLAYLKNEVFDVLTQIKFATPAKIKLVGYPRLVPANDEKASNCGWLTPIERTRVNKLVEDINNVYRGLADNRVDYISIVDALEGHELCTKDSWVVPVSPGRNVTLDGQRPEQGHPSRKGQLAIASVVEPELH